MGKLTLAQLHEGGGEAYVTSAGQLTPKGKELFIATARSWERYLALNPRTTSPSLAKSMLRVFSEEGLNEPKSAVQVLQLIVAAEPNSASFYAQLAQYAYKAKNPRVGDLAAAKAIKLAPAAQRAHLKAELDAVKKAPNGGGQILTSTTNGKTFTGKADSTGKGFVGTEVKTTPPPAGSTTTTTK